MKKRFGITPRRPKNSIAKTGWNPIGTLFLLAGLIIILMGIYLYQNNIESSGAVAGKYGIRRGVVNGPGFILLGALIFAFGLIIAVPLRKKKD